MQFVVHSHGKKEQMSIPFPRDPDDSEHLPDSDDIPDQRRGDHDREDSGFFGGGGSGGSGGGGKEGGCPMTLLLTAVLVAGLAALLRLARRRPS